MLIARQHASVVEEDANFFKTMVYGTEKLIFLATVVSACVGAFLLLVGFSLVLFQAWKVRAPLLLALTWAARVCAYCWILLV